MEVWFIVLFILIIVIAVLFAYRSEIMATITNLIPGRFTAKLKHGGRGSSRLKLKDLKKYKRTKSEAAAIKHLEELTGRQFPTVNPSWLKYKGRSLELDGYDGDKIALEFSGPLHTKWSPRFEPYTEYFERIVRDVVKRRLCKKHGVVLIVVDMSLPQKHWRDYIASRLYDNNLLARPANYIAEQTPEVFRNKQLEAEYNLGKEMLAAEQM